jgi:hypothetical protein
MTRFARYVSVHEAGHAVADTVLFGGVTEVKLWREGRRTRGHSVPLPADNVSSRGLSVVLYACAVAHAKLYRWGTIPAMLAGGRSDLARVNEICSEAAAAHGVSDVRVFRAQWHISAEHSARALVAQHWDWILRVADHLSRHGRITGAGVRRLEAAGRV